jgi:hypothetical protein
MRTAAMTTVAQGQAPAVETPKHPLYALATFELDGYRRELERAIAFFDRTPPVAPVQADLHAALDAVLAEQESRRRLADG